MPDFSKLKASKVFPTKVSPEVFCHTLYLCIHHFLCIHLVAKKYMALCEKHHILEKLSFIQLLTITHQAFWKIKQIKKMFAKICMNLHYPKYYCPRVWQPVFPTNCLCNMTVSFATESHCNPIFRSTILLIFLCL